MESLDDIRNSDELLNRRPAIKHLMKNLFPQYAVHWRKIGLSLGILEPILDNIDADHPYIKEKFQAVLMRWLEIYPDTTWRAIITAVDHLEDAHITNEKKMKLEIEVKNDKERFKEYLEQAKRNNETEELRLFKLIIFGPPRVGKSSLFQVLVDKEPKEVTQSTGVFNRQLFKVAITQDGTECISKWDIISIKNEIARLQAALEEKRKNAEKVHKSEEKSEFESTPSIPLTKVENQMLEEYDQPGPLSYTKKYTTVLMVCYDSGGQPEFFDIMPALATSLTGYIMVFDMSKDLDTPSEYEVVINNEKYLAQSKISSIQMMKGAVAGIQSHCSYDQMLIVGTHLEKCLSAGKNLKDIDKHIYKNLVQDKEPSFVRKREKGKQLQYIYPINNLVKSDKRDRVAQEIRSAVEKISENENIRAEIPINWHLLQLEIQMEIENTPKRNYISLASCIKFAEQCGIDVKQTKIDEILEYFHSLGIILYYRKTVNNVVFSPQWLFDRLSDIVFLKYSCENLDYDVQENIEKGVIERRTFMQLYHDKMDADGPLKLDQLLEIFASQHIIAEFPDKENFFIPALLNTAPPDMKHVDTKKYGQKVYKTLYVKFDQQDFPHVVFCCLATHFMEEGWNIQDEYRYSNIMLFQAPHSKYFVALFDNTSELAIEAYDEKRKHISVTEISYLISKFMTKFCKDIHISSAFKFGFTCNIASCTHIACVELQYPYLTEKYCKKCNRSYKLLDDEMAWLISPQDVCDIFKTRYHQVDESDQSQQDSTAFGIGEHPIVISSEGFTAMRLFDFEAVQKNLKEKSALLTNIPYKSMQQLLFAKSVITLDEKQHLDKMINSEQISVLIDILLVSLKLKVTKKYKGFLQSMEESGDLTLEEMAKELGE